MARPTSKIDLRITYKNNAGFCFKVIDYKNASNVTIQFVNSGLIKKVTMTHVKRGSVKDELEPSIYGIGIIGIGKYTPTLNRNKTIQYKCWVGMLHRCYYPKFLNRFPSYIDCYVCDEWLNFQTFADWFDNNYPCDGGKYELDKDIKINGNKIYSPSTCLFVTQDKNKEKAFAKYYTLISPLGVYTKIYNMEKFCRESSIHSSNVNKVLSGKLNHTGGWTKP